MLSSGGVELITGSSFTANIWTTKDDSTLASSSDSVAFTVIVAEPK